MMSQFEKTPKTPKPPNPEALYCVIEAINGGQKVIINRVSIVAMPLYEMIMVCRMGEQQHMS